MTRRERGQEYRLIREQVQSEIDQDMERSAREALSRMGEWEGEDE